MCRIARTCDVTRPLVCYHEPTCRRTTDEMTSQRFSRTVLVASSVVITRLRRHPIVDHNLIWNGISSLEEKYEQPDFVTSHDRSRSCRSQKIQGFLSYRSHKSRILSSTTTNNVTTSRCQLVWTECSVCGIRMTRLKNVLKFSYKMRT